MEHTSSVGPLLVGRSSLVLLVVRTAHRSRCSSFALLIVCAAHRSRCSLFALLIIPAAHRSRCLSFVAASLDVEHTSIVRLSFIVCAIRSLVVKMNTDNLWNHLFPNGSKKMSYLKKKYIILA